MKRDNVNYFMVGVFMIGMICLLLMVLYRITGTSGFHDTYYVTLKNLSGLTNGAPATYEGFVFGNVRSITPTQNADGTLYRVGLLVQDGWKIPQDSIARIHSAGLLGDIVINVEEGSSKNYLSVNSEIPSGLSDDIFVAMGKVAGELSELTRTTIKPMLQNINHQVGNIGNEFDQNVPRLFQSLDRLMADMKNVSGKLSELVNEKNVGRVNAILANVDQGAHQFGDLLRDLDKTKKQMDTLLVSTNGMVAENQKDVRQSVIALRDSMELISSQLSSILVNLDSTGRNMNEFSRNIRLNPGLLISSTPPKEKANAHE